MMAENAESVDSTLEPIRKGIDLAVALDRVWTALTDEAQLASWFERAQFASRVGQPIKFWGFDGPRKYTNVGVLRVWEPNQRLVYDWEPFNGGWDGPLTVEFTLTPRDGGTHLDVQEAGYENIPAGHAEAFRAQADRAWEALLPEFKQFLEVGPADLALVRDMPTSPERLWRAIVYFADLREWFPGTVVRLDPRPGGRIDLRLVIPDLPPEMITGRVTRFRPRELMAIEWRPANWPLGSRVALAVEPRDGQTQMVLSQYGFDTLPADMRATELSNRRTLWGRFLDHLEDYMASDPP